MSHEQIELVVASRNRKKSGELNDLLAPHGIHVRSVAEFPEVPEILEDGDSFAANAAKKACETAALIQHWVLAEDSGLCVDALGGAPGIFSARFSDPGATDERNNAKLIAELAQTPEERRGAHYVCHVAVADPSGQLRLTVEQRCRGRISHEPRGTSGFGYDPYFLIPEYHQTFGELGMTVKHAISHRARAMRQLVPRLLVTLGLALGEGIRSSEDASKRAAGRLGG